MRNTQPPASWRARKPNPPDRPSILDQENDRAPAPPRVPDLRAAEARSWQRAPPRCGPSIRAIAVRAVDRPAPNRGRYRMRPLPSLIPIKAEDVAPRHVIRRWRGFCAPAYLSGERRARRRATLFKGFGPPGGDPGRYERQAFKVSITRRRHRVPPLSPPTHGA